MYILFYVKKFFILYGFDTKVIHELIRICTTCIRYILCHFFHYTNFKSLGELRGFEPLSLLLRVVYLPINTIALYSFTLRFLSLSSWAWNVRSPESLSFSFSSWRTRSSEYNDKSDVLSFSSLIRCTCPIIAVCFLFSCRFEIWELSFHAPYERLHGRKE